MNKPSKLRKILKAVVAIVIILVVVVVIGASNFLVSYAIGKAGDGGNREVALDVDDAATDIEKTINENRNKQIELADAFEEEMTPEIVTIESNDGLQLLGYYYPQESSHDWVIAIHGYRSSHKGAVYGQAPQYYEHGYHVLAPDLRACGESGGDYVGMGWPDRKDILNWIDWILERDPQAEIVLHGTSMGAATTMMVSGEETPDNVKVFVEDCGYTSVLDIFGSELTLRFGLPKFPLLYTASGFASMRAGYSFSEASSVDQVAKCEKPMLFIHGTLDDFVPYDMVNVVYEAKPGDNKKLVTAEGAGHGEAMYALGDTYWDEVFDFIDTYK